MFYEAIQMGFEKEDTSISHDDALQIILGGIIKFLYDYKQTNDLVKCENYLYYISKAATALREQERRKCSTLLGIIAAMDPSIQDYSFVLNRAADILGVDCEILENYIDSMNLNDN